MARTEDGGTALSSMTGYARSTGQTGAATWTWELKSVNGKGLEVRLRLPPGMDGLDAPARARVASRVTRGTLHVALNLQRPRPEQALRIDRGKLTALVTAVAGIGLPPGIAPATLDGLLALPGVVEVSDLADAPAGDLDRRLLADLDEALDALAAMRAQEGDALGRVLDDRLTRIASCAGSPNFDAAVPPLDPLRLHQEALLMAAKADVREELDRLAIHAAAAAALLDQGGAVGRRLDFLAQELGREAGTLCAKSNDAALTTAGLALRTEIEQFREQVQNLE